MKFLLLFPFLIGLMAFSNSKMEPRRVLFFGDSITEMGVQTGGYIDLLRKMPQEISEKPPVDFLGAGIGGNKVYDLYLRLDDDVLAKKPSTVVIWVGVNDVWHKKTFGTGTDADKFEKFYRAILKKTAAAGIAAILVTPAAIGERHSGDNAMDAELDKYSDLIRKIAKETSSPCCDLRQIFMDFEAKNNPKNLESGILTTDGVHLNAAGNRLVAEKMAELVF